MGMSKLCQPSPHRQTGLSAPELEGRPPSCSWGDTAGKSLGQQVAALPACSVHRGLGSGAGQLRTPQPWVPCSLKTLHDDWWEEWRPILGCSVFPGPACGGGFLLSVLLPLHPAWLRGGADAFSPWLGEPLGPLSSRGWWAAGQGSEVPGWGPSRLPQPIWVAVPVTHEVVPTFTSLVFPAALDAFHFPFCVSLSHQSLSPKDLEHLEMQQSFYSPPL